MRPIYKTVLRVTVYSEDGSPLEGCSLADMGEAIDIGDDIGEVETVSRETITDPAQLHRELLAIGNDGTFFGEVDE